MRQTSGDKILPDPQDGATWQPLLFRCLTF